MAYTFFAMCIGDIANHLLQEYRNKDSNEVVAREERQPLLVSTVLLEALSYVTLIGKSEVERLKHW